MWYRKKRMRGLSNPTSEARMQVMYLHISLNETSRFNPALIDDALAILKSAEEAKFDIKI